MNLPPEPTLKELLEIQQDLLRDITEAAKLFGRESTELRTLRSGLKHLEEKIDKLRAKNGDG